MRTEALKRNNRYKIHAGHYGNEDGPIPTANNIDIDTRTNIAGKVKIPDRTESGFQCVLGETP